LHSKSTVELRLSERQSTERPINRTRKKKDNGTCQVHVFENCDEENINEWLLIDTNNPGYKILSDDEIVHSLFEEDGTEGEENETDDFTEGDLKAVSF
jgi:hypothetical protein